jgi:hypothetical protein
MEELQVVWDEIVDSKSASKWVELADYYIEMYNKNPAIFVLPTAHNKLSPVIKAYHNDIRGFLLFVRGIRDALVGDEKIKAHIYYRKITSRSSQQVRRARLNQALEQIEEHLNLKFNSSQREAVGMWLTQYWGKARVDALDAERGETTSNRLDTTTRAEICQTFWDEVDKNLANNIVPIPPEIVYGKLTSLESYKPNSV